MANALQVVSVVVQEIMSASKIPGGKIFGQVLTVFQKNREKQAREILFKRIRNAEIETIEAADQDELIGVIFSYFQAASNGAARVNLDLLSQAIAGEMKRDKIYPDKFLKYANILSTLTRDEIFVTGVYFRCRNELLVESEAKPELRLGASTRNTWGRFIGEIVPSSFPTEEHVKVILSGLSRTGLIRTLATSIQEVGVPTYSILLDEIAELIDFEESYKEYPEY